MVLPGRRRSWLLVSLLTILVGLVEGGAAGTVYLLVQVMQDPRSVFDMPVVSTVADRSIGSLQ